MPPGQKGEPSRKNKSMMEAPHPGAERSSEGERASRAQGGAAVGSVASGCVLFISGAAPGDCFGLGAAESCGRRRGPGTGTLGPAGTVPSCRECVVRAGMRRSGGA